MRPFRSRFGLGDLAAAIAVLFLVDALDGTIGLRAALPRLPTWVRWPVYCLLLFAILLLGEFGARSFIYFQF